MVWCLEPHDMWWVVQSVVPIHCVCPTPLLCLYWEVNYNTTVNYTQGGTGKQIKQYLVFIVKHLFLINMIYSWYTAVPSSGQIDLFVLGLILLVLIFNHFTLVLQAHGLLSLVHQKKDNLIKWRSAENWDNLKKRQIHKSEQPSNLTNEDKKWQ